MNRILLLLPLAASALLLGAAAASGSSSTGLAVAQVFAGGGNTGAPYANDYVELFNAGGASVDVDGWTLQYASAAGTTWQATPLAGTITAGGRYLVQLASGGSVGAALPAPDATGTSNLAVSGGKVALVHDATALTCGGAAGSCSGVASLEDLVGYGGAADYEGNAAAPALTAAEALVRAGGGCTDSDDNAADFATAAPAPQNSAAAPAPCSAPGPGGVGGDAAVDVDVQPVLSITLDHATLSFAGAVPGTTPAPLAEQATVTSNDPSGYTLGVRRTAFTPADLPLGIGVTLPAGASAGGAPTDGSLAPVPSRPRPICCSARPPRRAPPAETPGRRVSASSPRCRWWRPGTTARRSRSPWSAGEAARLRGAARGRGILPGCRGRGRHRPQRLPLAPGPRSSCTLGAHDPQPGLAGTAGGRDADALRLHVARPAADRPADGCGDLALRPAPALPARAGRRRGALGRRCAAAACRAGRPCGARAPDEPARRAPQGAGAAPRRHPRRRARARPCRAAAPATLAPGRAPRQGAALRAHARQPRQRHGAARRRPGAARAPAPGPRRRAASPAAARAAAAEQGRLHRRLSGPRPRTRARPGRDPAPPRRARAAADLLCGR